MNFVKTHLDKINFVLIVFLFLLHFGFFPPSQSPNTEQDTPRVGNTSAMEQEQATATDPSKKVFVSMAMLVKSGFRPNFSIIEVNGKSYKDKDEALTKAREHDLNSGDLSIVYLNDKGEKNKIKLGVKDLPK